jgi:hypothetical protein
MSKKNNGNASKIRLAKEQKYITKNWKDSHGNSKFLCLSCFKSMKSPTKCCGFNMYNLGKRARTPKIRASKAEWKKFFDMFLFVRSDSNRSQAKKIIEIRKSYNLSTLKDEEALKKMINTVEHDIIGVLDIKRHEMVEYTERYSFQQGKSLLDIVLDRAKHLNAILDYDKLVTGKEYFIVPMFASTYRTNYIPIDFKKYDIKKCMIKKIPQQYSSNHTIGFKIMTGNSKEIVEHGYQLHSKYGYRQNFYIFDDRIKALAFRQEFLSLVFPILKEKELPYLSEIVDIVNLDFERVTKRAPELLV